MRISFDVTQRVDTAYYPGEPPHLCIEQQLLVLCTISLQEIAKHCALNGPATASLTMDYTMSSLSVGSYGYNTGNETRCFPVIVAQASVQIPTHFSQLNPWKELNLFYKLKVSSPVVLLGRLADK